LNEKKDEMIKDSIKYQVLCPYTAFFIAERIIEDNTKEIKLVRVPLALSA
jgi:hypothetical protein